MPSKSSGTNKLNVQRQYYNALGQMYRSTQSLDTTPATTAESRMTFDAMGRAATSTGFDGVTTILGYDAFGSVGSVTVDVNKDGKFAPSSGDQRALYSSMYVKSGAKSMVFQSSKVIKGDGTLPDSAMFERTAISGLSSTRWVNGMEDKRSLSIDSESHKSTVTTTRADGTKVTENYPDRSLLSANDNSSGQTDMVGHDGLLRTTSVAGTFGTTIYNKAPIGEAIWP